MRTRAQYDQAFEIVREVVARWDPYKLISGGAPRDEFDHEIARLLTLLQRVRSPTEASAAVAEVFTASLGDDSVDVKAWGSIGRELYSRLTAAGLLTAAATARE